MAFITEDGKDIGDVKIFTMSTCAWCDKMKRLLSVNGVKYRYIDMDLVDEEERERTVQYLNSLYPKWGFPCLVYVNKVLIVGYQEEEIRSTLGLVAAEPNESKGEVKPVGEEVQKIMERLQRYSEKKHASLNPDTQITAKLIESLLENQKRYGYWACPCRLVSGKREEDRDIICPCDYWEPDVLEFGACFCGLFVSQKVVTGKMAIKTVPERRKK